MSNEAKTPVQAALKPAPDQTKVVSLSSKPQAEALGSVTTSKPRSKGGRGLWWSFVFCVVLPIIAGSAYIGLYASDRYAVTAGFAVRGVNANAGLDGIGSLTGLASAGSTTSDSYIILKYLKSRDIVEKLQAEIGLQAAFTAATIDPLSRMAPDQPIEAFLRYWERMMTTSFDATSGIVSFEVVAFDAAEAYQLGSLVLALTEDLVNELSQSARQDSLRFAETEVATAEARLRAALEDMRQFREQRQSIDPAAAAQLGIALDSALEARLIDLRARIASIAQSLDPDAPSLMALRRQAAALEVQIAERAAHNQPDAGAVPMSGLLARYEALEVEKSFAQQAYQSALSSLEQARAEADRQQRYLAVFTRPALPQDAIYPKRGQNILLLITIAICAWGIGTLIVYSVRDHMS